MTDTEFNSFLDTCRSCFSFVDRLVQERETDRFRMWRKALAPVSAAMADEYLTAVVSGRIPAPKYPSDWDSFASECRVWCQAEEARRNPPPPRERPHRPDRRREFREHLRLRGFSELAAKLDREDPITT